MRARLLSLALGLVGGGCADIAGFDGNPQMDPGQDCLVCHSESGQASNLSFSVGGTVYPSALAGTEGGLFNAEIDITDATNRQLTLHSNGAGNFYSAEPIVFPATVSIKVGDQVFAMQTLALAGNCNACHAVSTNADGTLSPAALPAFAVDAGTNSTPPGHLYGFVPPAECPAYACPDPAPSYSSQVKAIVEANCFLCHDPALPPPQSQTPPLDTYEQIHAASDINLDWLSDCAMPPFNDPDHPWFPMSPDERALLTDWVACGSPSN